VTTMFHWLRLVGLLVLGLAWIGHVPVSQQNAQGAILKNFFKQNSIKAGDQYQVIITP